MKYHTTTEVMKSYNEYKNSENKRLVPIAGNIILNIP